MTLLAAKWVMFFSDRKFARRQNHLHFSVNKISPATQRIAPILQALQSVQLSFFSEGAKAKQTIIAISSMGDDSDEANIREALCLRSVG